MDHLAQDLSVALEESESCGPVTFEVGRKWGMRRRTRSAGNLHLGYHKSADNLSDDSSSTNSEIRIHHRSKISHQSDSDEMSVRLAVSRVINNRSQSLRMKHQIHNLLRGRYNRLGLPMSHSLESDSLNEHSPARPMRRKRKLKRMSVDETPVPPCGKRKRPQRLDIVESCRSLKNNPKIKPLNQAIVNKIEKYCQHTMDVNECDNMETQCVNDNCDVASESSLSWSGDEGHEGDDELTDWTPSVDNSMDQAAWIDADPREIRAGCRRLRDERPGFSISTGANERVARFLQDSSKSELRLYGAEKEKLAQLASLYSLELWFEGPSSLLRKTGRTPAMQPSQRHHNGLTAAHKRIRTQDHIISLKIAKMLSKMEDRETKGLKNSMDTHEGKVKNFSDQLNMDKVTSKSVGGEINKPDTAVLEDMDILKGRIDTLAVVDIQIDGQVKSYVEEAKATD